MWPEVCQSPYLVPFDGTFRQSDAATTGAEVPSRKRCEKNLDNCIERLDDLQRVLYAADTHALLLVFQAMDAAGKDSTIRAVTRGVNPAGFQVSAFKKPSQNELDQDFLWRSARRLPQRGRIGIFNRSYYEEVLVVRVHPEYLRYQRLPTLDAEPAGLAQLWDERYRSIREHERHLAANGTVVLKFWLNVSRDEQARRFVDRIDEPQKNWKFNAGDVAEREHWDAYMSAYDAALNATSRAWAPWYAIPADDKPYMRWMVADIIVRTLERLDLQYPKLAPDERADLAEHRRQLVREVDDHG